jgi:hypothetical protein
MSDMLDANNADSGSDEDREEEEAPSAGSAGPTVFYLSQEPRLADFGKYNYLAGVEQRDTCLRIASNIGESIKTEGFVGFADDELIEAFVCALLSVAKTLFEQYKRLFHEKTGQALSLGVVMTFLMELLKQSAYGISPSQSFGDLQEDVPAYVRAKDPISYEDFMVLWNLLEVAENMAPALDRLYQPLRGHDKILEAVTQAGMKFNRSLFAGVEHVHVAIDDLMTHARNKQSMADAGVAVKVNDKKASGVGCSADATVACPRAQIMIDFSYRDDAAKQSGSSRAQTLIKATLELKEAGVETTTTFDRGYEPTILAFHKAGLETISTSMKASASRPSNVFAWDVKRPFSAAVEANYMVVRTDNPEGPGMPFCSWATNTPAGRPMLHLCTQWKKAGTPVAMKSSRIDLLGEFVQIPALEGDRISLAKAYKKSLDAASPGVAAPDDGLFDFDPLDALQSDRFIRYKLSQVQVLGVAQRTPGWFRNRHAITSTRLRILVRWYGVCLRFWQLRGENGPLQVQTLIQRLYRREPSGPGAEMPVVEPQELLNANRHIAFLRKVATSDDEALSEVLKKVAGARLDTCEGSDMYAALESLKLPTPAKPARRVPWAPEQLAAMRQMLRTHAVSDAGCDLATLLLADITKVFKGNEHTRLGQIGEDALAAALPELLPNTKFKTSQGSGSDLVEVKPFHFVSPITSTGCIAPFPGSHCVTSNDGIFAVKESENGPLIAYQLECKTKTSPATISAARTIVHNRFFLIKPDSAREQLQELARYVTDSDFSLQILHHAASARIERVLVALIDGLKGIVIRYVAVQFDEALLEQHRQMIQTIVRLFVPFWQRNTALSWKGIAPERLNFNRVLRELAIAVDVKVKDKATLPLVNAIYNATKSGVDVLHRKIGSRNSTNLGARRRMKLTALDCILHSARQVARVYLARKKLPSADSPEEVSRILNEVGSDEYISLTLLRRFTRAMHHTLAPPKSVAIELSIEEPSRRPQFPPEDPQWPLLVLAKRNKAVGKERSRHPGFKSRPGTAALRSGRLTSVMTAFFCDADLILLRTNASPEWSHDAKAVSHKERLRCDLCCLGCENGTEHKYRLGQLTAFKCSLCQVWLCKEPRAIWGGVTCWDRFHFREERPKGHPFNTHEVAASPAPDATLGLSATVAFSSHQVVTTLTSLAQRRLAKSKTPEEHRKRRRRARSAAGMASEDGDDGVDEEEEEAPGNEQDRESGEDEDADAGVEEESTGEESGEEEHSVSEESEEEEDSVSDESGEEDELSADEESEEEEVPQSRRSARIALKTCRTLHFGDEA